MDGARAVTVDRGGWLIRPQFLEAWLSGGGGGNVYPASVAVVTATALPVTLPGTPYQRIPAIYDSGDVLAWWDVTTETTREDIAGNAYTEAVNEYRRHQQEQAATQARYEAMLDKVMAWRAPTPDHLELKKFMIQQLEESIRFDCGYERPAPVRQTAADWLAEQIAQAERNAERHAEDHEKAVERAEQRTAWVRALRESLAESVSS